MVTSDPESEMEWIGGFRRSFDKRFYEYIQGLKLYYRPIRYSIDVEIMKSKKSGMQTVQIALQWIQRKKWRYT